MATINQVKQLAESDSPLVLFQCVLPSGDVECWSTHAIMFAGQTYSARVLKHNLFELRLSADDAMDGISHLALTLANADSYLSEINNAVGFKGTQLTVYFAFADLSTQTITTESTVLFRGIAGDPDEVTEDALSLSFQNKLSLQRIPIPEVRIQRSCPWNFPSSSDQRIEAKDGGFKGQFSAYFRCGYSADVAGGVGNLTGGQPFASCDKSRTQCVERGMFNIDHSGNKNARFGAFEFVPSAVMVRTSGDKSSHVSPLITNLAKYNDPVPIVYGTGWLKAPVIFARNDGNLTHMEVILGMGVIQGVLKIVVNDIEIPEAAGQADVTTTGWYSVFTTGGRSGSFNLDFEDGNGNPAGDPYGSIAVASIVVPNRISSGKSAANVEVLLQGTQIDSYSSEGVRDNGWSDNPAWVILDILQRCGWSTTDLDLTTFVSSAQFCQTLIQTTDLNGNSLQVPRYKCNLILTRRQSAAAVIRGIRVASSLMLRYGATGLLELVPETTIASQQPALPDGSNSTEPLNGGWPAYEFSDSSAPYSGIVRNQNGSSTVKLTSRMIAETSNRLSVEFQDESNEYQQDSLSLVDSVDSALIGYEVSSQSTALGIANLNQATRVLLRQIDKSTKGNLFVEFLTSFRALKVRPGDLIALTYLKEGFSRRVFRVSKLSPSMNYQLVTVLAQSHDDDWYSDSPSVLGGAGRQPGSQTNTPRPLIGVTAQNHSAGSLYTFDFAVSELIQAQKDGSATDTLTIGFSQPTRPSSNSPSLPLLNFSPGFDHTTGSLAGGQTLYYGVSAVDSAGNEGTLSFTVPATIPGDSNTNSVILTGLSFPTTAATFNVYRGANPQLLYRIASGIKINSSNPTYTDSGASYLPIGPADPSFDHANFYCRTEFAGPFQATSVSPSSISNADMGADPGAYAGKGYVARIIDGPGRGQERLITSSDQTTLTISPNWSVMPDTSSTYVIAEGAWKLAAVSATSPLQFEVPYRAGSVIQISGRAANVNNLEGSADLCPLTRWALGQSSPDAGLPASPDFSLGVSAVGSAPQPTSAISVPGGYLTLYQVGFTDLSNAASIGSGTLEIFYWSELGPVTTYSLSAAMSANGQDSSSGTLQVSSANGTDQLKAGTIIQVDDELLEVASYNSAQNTYSVNRAQLGSLITSHSVSTKVLQLTSSTFIVPFAPGFFETRASANFMHTISLPDVRIAAATFFVTNAFGDGLSQQQCYTGNPNGGLRTLSGGQFSMQVSGVVATQENAAPPLIVETSHAVRDVFATLGQAAAGYTVIIDVLQNGSEYCNLQISPTMTTSYGLSSPQTGPLSGANLPALMEGATLSINISLQVDQSFTGQPSPGRDLTLTIRL